ncbi:MAG: cell division protein FtsQ [candidate division WS2 bacterium ADurb.Bin280]|uniref:Cell division protein FtsQ n=1 Tax=candidate division WS2 bacterium ADurb.Bin280 TaxID=1852829 RepID=A0A1V5SEZ6_9BACT|nr:MAG: cell division protein FtsQ [candidate division WS2 bacterium ADurb.Bin280]
MNNLNPDYNKLRRKEILLRTQKQDKKRSFSLSPRIVRFLKNLAYSVVLIFVIYFAVFSPTFRIRDVKAEGIETGEIYDRIALDMMGKNIFLINIAGYLKKITAEFPVIEEARVVRGLPSTLRVEIKERDVALIWCNEKCFEIDNRGLAYRETQNSPTGIVVSDKSNIEINIGDKVVSQKFVDFYKKSIDAFERIGVSVSEASVEDTTFKLSFKTQKGYTVIFDTSSSLENQIYALEQIIANGDQEIGEYVDLRVEGLAYVK